MMNHQPIELVRGFLPEEDPLTILHPAYEAWDQLGKELPKLLLSDSFQHILKDLPILATDRLHSQQDLERAMLLLSFFGHAYVWGIKNSDNYLPISIAKPWYEVALRLGRPPILSYASYALNNWQRLDPNKLVELGNIVLLQNFLGGLDEEWFVLVHIDIEMKASNALQLFPIVQIEAENNNYELLIEHLMHIKVCLENMCTTLDRMPERCDPYIYYNRVRPYIHGWKDNPALPQGLIYEGVEVWGNKPQKFRGETGAQSSIIPAFDALFGIHHHEDPLRIYLNEMREYMPPLHRKFIEKIERKGSIRNVIVRVQTAYPDLRNVYNECIYLLARFRKTHLSYAAQYIQKQSQTSLANPTGTGTGGTPFMEYLRKHKDETLQYLIKE